MGYSNSFNLKVEGTLTKKVKTSTCHCHTTTQDLTQNFCNKCGTKLLESEIESNALDIIKELTQSNKEGDCRYLLDEFGDSRESGSGFNINNEIKDFSKKYPSLTFILSCKWESGLVDEGHPGTDYFFFKNGVEKKSKVKVVYTDPFKEKQFIKIDL